MISDDDHSGMIFDESQVLQAYESNNADTGGDMTPHKGSLNSSASDTYIGGGMALPNETLDSSDVEFTEDQ